MTKRIVNYQENGYNTDTVVPILSGQILDVLS